MSKNKERKNVNLFLIFIPKRIFVEKEFEKRFCTQYYMLVGILTQHFMEIKTKTVSSSE